MKKLLFPLMSLMFLWSCDPNTVPEEQTIIGTDTVPADRTQRRVGAYHVVRDSAVEVGGIRVSPIEDSPEFSDGILEMNYPESEARIAGKQVQFNYNIKNFRLGHQTDRSACPKCSNSEKGQHIHLILNNKPYLARYETSFKENLEPGHYVALSFLSRSYHESVKHSDAYVLRQFSVGEGKADQVDLSKPFLFYSRPKDEYVGDDAKKVLLDFYLVNTDLSEQGHKVRATINGNEFILVNWQPYIMENLPIGEVTIKLELLDVNDNLVDTPFNPSERTITLKEGPGA
ncbi:MAG: hypothetical protein ACK4ND_02480 [Cytophagaceae bacterium]